MAVRGKVLLPYLIPKLATGSARHATALAQLSTASGEALGKHLPRILDALLAATDADINDGQNGQAPPPCLDVLLVVQDQAGQEQILTILLKKLDEEDAAMRAVSARLLSQYCQEAKVRGSSHASSLRRIY